MVMAEKITLKPSNNYCYKKMRDKHIDYAMDALWRVCRKGHYMDSFKEKDRDLVVFLKDFFTKQTDFGKAIIYKNVNPNKKWVDYWVKIINTNRGEKTNVPYIDNNFA